MSTADRWRVGVLVEWQAVDNPWIDHRWRVVGVLPGAPDLPDWTLLADGPAMRRYYAGAADLLLFPRETDTLKHNLEGAAPSIYVILRASDAEPGIALLGATVCVGEAHAHADTGTDILEAVPMLPEIAAWMADFVARHHVDREGFKREREGVVERGRR